MQMPLSAVLPDSDPVPTVGRGPGADTPFTPVGQHPMYGRLSWVPVRGGARLNHPHSTPRDPLRHPPFDTPVFPQ